MMDNLTRIADQVARRWSRMTLEDLRSQAALEDTGVAFDAIKTNHGERLCMILCVTGEDNINHVAANLSLNDDGITEDWTTLTLAEVFNRTAIGRGIAFETMRGTTGTPLAITLIAAVPESVALLERVFRLPN